MHFLLQSTLSSTSTQALTSKSSVIFKNKLVNQSLLVCTEPENSLELFKWGNKALASTWWQLILWNSFAFVWHLADKSGMSVSHVVYGDYSSLHTHTPLTGKGQFRFCWCWHVYLSDLNYEKKKKKKAGKNCSTSLERVKFSALRISLSLSLHRYIFAYLMG